MVVSPTTMKTAGVTWPAIRVSDREGRELIGRVLGDAHRGFRRRTADVTVRAQLGL